MAFIAFGGQATTLFGLTKHDAAPWDANISKLGGFKGDTRYKQALMAAKAIFDADDALIKKIVFMSDAQAQDETEVQDAIDALVMSQISVDTVYFGQHFTDKNQLESISTGTGGSHRDVEKPSAGTTNTPAVEAQALNTIIAGTVGPTPPPCSCGI